LEEDLIIKCLDCGDILYSGPDKTVDGIKCNRCCSTRKDIVLTVEDRIDIHEQQVIKGKRKNEKRPFVEGKYGDEIYHETGEWREVNRTVDRDQNRYQEKIVNSRTGEVVKDISEPLDQHCGHGSAKRKHSKQIKSK